MKKAVRDTAAGGITESDFDGTPTIEDLDVLAGYYGHAIDVRYTDKHGNDVCGVLVLVPYITLDEMEETAARLRTIASLDSEF